jgi:hypothetical protein
LEDADILEDAEADLLDETDDFVFAVFEVPDPVALEAFLEALDADTASEDDDRGALEDADILEDAEADLLDETDDFVFAVFEVPDPVALEAFLEALDADTASEDDDRGALEDADILEDAEADLLDETDDFVFAVFEVPDPVALEADAALAVGGWDASDIDSMAEPTEIPRETRSV